MYEIHVGIHTQYRLNTPAPICPNIPQKKKNCAIHHCAKICQKIASIRTPSELYKINIP
jgi:hypothetical protein